MMMLSKKEATRFKKGVRQRLDNDLTGLLKDKN